jgi:type I restriction enzyme S subunit
VSFAKSAEMMSRPLPKGWTWVPLGQYVENHDGRRVPISRSERESRQGAFPYYGASGVIDTIDGFTHEGEFVLIGEDGANLLTRSKPLAFLTRGKVWVNNHAHVLRCKPGFSNAYLAYYINSINLSAYVTGTAQPKLSQSMMNKIPIPVAPPEQQTEIVAEIEKQFSRLDEAVANLQRVKANLKRYKASVLKAAVEGRLVETEASIAQREGRSYETGEQLLQSTLKARQTQWVGRGKYKTPEPPQESDASLPEGWAWATLEQLHLQIADVDHKMPKAQESGIPYISTKDFFADEGIDFTKAKLISAEDYEALCRKVKPERGDLLLSRYGTVGEVREVSIDEPFQASYSVAILKPVRGFVPIRFLIAALRSDVVIRQIKRDVRATAQPDLGLAHIRQFVVPVPPMAEQLRILEELDRQLSILRGIETVVENNLLRAQTLRQSTLSKAFSDGVLNV